MQNAFKFLLFAAVLPFFATAQITKRNVEFSTLTLVEGKVIDHSSGNPLSQVSVVVYDDVQKMSIAQTQTNTDGSYSIKVPLMQRYQIVADKATYFESDTILSAVNGHIAADLELSRKPGYVFDITLFDKAFDDQNPINTMRDCKVEIYNNTTQEQVLTIERLPKSTFNFSFAEGNHYTMLIRKPGYLNRRIEVYVNVNGCILCVDGMGVKEPDLVPLMSHNNEIGYFLGTVELDSIEIGKRFQLKNIYYDFDKWDIRPEAAVTLDKLSMFLKDNPGIKVELGSHTDARGSDDYNLVLSDKRAEAAVQYLVDNQGIDGDMITFKGYGETQLINRCDDGINCSENEHQMNRRTEIKITGQSEKDPLWDKSLKQIIEDKELYRKVLDQEKRQKATKAK